MCMWVHVHAQAGACVWGGEASLHAALAATDVCVCVCLCGWVYVGGGG